MMDFEDVKLIICPCCEETSQIEWGCDAGDYECENCCARMVEEY